MPTWNINRDHDLGISLITSADMDKDNTELAFSSSSQQHALKCPPGMDESVFTGLPQDIQREVIAQYNEQHDQQDQQVRQGSDNIPVNSIERSDPSTEEQPLDTKDDIPPVVPSGLVTAQNPDLAREEQNPSRAHRSPIGYPRQSFFNRCKAKSDDNKSTKARPGAYRIDFESGTEEYLTPGCHGALNNSDAMASTPDRSGQAQCVADTKEEQSNLPLDGFDPETLAALPEDIRREVLEAQLRENQEVEHSSFSTPPREVIGHPATTGKVGYSTKDFDPEVLENLPDDIRLELLSFDGDSSQTWDGDSSQTWNGENSQTWDLLPQVEPRWDSPSFAPVRSCSESKYRQTMPTILSDDSKDADYSNNDNILTPQKLPKRHTNGSIPTHFTPEARDHRDQSPTTPQPRVEKCRSRYIGNHDTFGRRTGQGELRWENGDKFKGLFVDGVRDGPGTLWVHDGSIYEGNWKNDQFDGYGVRKLPSGYVYAGYYQNGRSHGQGKCEFPSGDKYEGEWHDGLMDGLGKYRHKQNGDVYEGMFRQGKRDGSGRYRYKNRRTDVIRYSNGQRVGEGVRWSKDGKKAWLLSGTEVMGKLSKEAAMKMQDRICGADIKIMDDNVLLHHRGCAIHTSPIRKKVAQQPHCNIPCMPNFQT